MRRYLSFALAYIIFPALLFAFFVILIVPYSVHAAEAVKCSTAFCPLASVADSPKLLHLYDSDKNLVEYINSLFKIAISLGAIIAVIRLGIAGYAYMGGEMWHTKEKAKEIIRDVFFGLFLLLSIWIILYQINPNLLNLTIKFPKVPPSIPSGVTPASPTAQGFLADIIRDEPRVRRLLNAAHVEINRNGVFCTQFGQRNCTNVGLLGDDAISGLAMLRSNCRRAYTNCSVEVTGGTEWWEHKGGTHGPNRSTVDLGKNSVLDKYIMERDRQPVSTKNGNLYTISGLGKFLDETIAGNPPHWHVVF